MGAELARPRIIDRYIRNQLLGWYAACVGVVVLLLWIESLPRLLKEVSGASLKATVIVRSLASLTPEYVAIALPIAAYLATAVVIRRLALNGELEALAASGLSDWRILRQPMILAAASALAVIALRGWVQPAGERELLAVGRSVQAGEFGFGLEPGVAHRMAEGTTLFFGTVDRAANEIGDVAVQSGGSTFIAASARIALSGRGGWSATLHDGNVLFERNGRREAMHFTRLTIRQSASPLALQPTPLQDRLAQLDLGRLLRPRKGRDGPSAAPAAAAAWTRIAAAALCFLLPMLAYAQSVPPKRSRSAIGFGIGIIEIIGFWKMSGWIGDRCTAYPALAQSLLLLVYAAAAWSLVRFQSCNGFGAFEQRLLRVVASAQGQFRQKPFLDRLRHPLRKDRLPSRRQKAVGLRTALYNFALSANEPVA